MIGHIIRARASFKDALY